MNTNASVPNAKVRTPTTSGMLEDPRTGPSNRRNKRTVLSLVPDVGRETTTASHLPERSGMQPCWHDRAGSRAARRVSNDVFGSASRCAGSSHSTWTVEEGAYWAYGKTTRKASSTFVGAFGVSGAVSPTTPS